MTCAHLPFHGWRPLVDQLAQEQLGRVLAAWEGTPYMAGQQQPGRQGGGVDCVRFVCGVLDALTGRRTPIKTIPPDTCFHDPAKALRASLAIRALYQPNDLVTDGWLEPGDVVVTGPLRGGPGHAMIVGHERNVVWHSAAHGVHRTGLAGVFVMGHRVFQVYRLRERAWRAA